MGRIVRGVVDAEGVEIRNGMPSPESHRRTGRLHVQPLALERRNPYGLDRHNRRFHEITDRPTCFDSQNVHELRFGKRPYLDDRKTSLCPPEGPAPATGLRAFPEFLR